MKWLWEVKVTVKTDRSNEGERVFSVVAEDYREAGTMALNQQSTGDYSEWVVTDISRRGSVLV